ncbi:sporulation protein [Halalkalibacter alkaliphilus]|uniref:Sporulation protein n=2 Tax=Bacillaceae TaxID=186817 RepID=A0A9X2I8N3_9BACI|nr:sporulation protein [Halalkalibacter alkaliphilus]MCL7748285.1 sporulation protein [Halalkalibacter alkaliphilus]
MLKKLLSSIGIGSAKVNTVLFQREIERGKEVTGEVHIFGGKVVQSISEVYIHVDTEFQRNDDVMTEIHEMTEPIHEVKIIDRLLIKPNEEKVIPFSFTLPHYTPITFSDQKIHLHTELNINFFNHPVDEHDFIVYDPFIEAIMHHLKKNGFRHTVNSGLCHRKAPTKSNPTHCLQVFELVNEQDKKIYFVGNEKDIIINIIQGDQVRQIAMDRKRDIPKQLLGIERSKL